MPNAFGLMDSLPQDLAAFLRDHFAPVAKPPEITYPKPWMPSPGDMEPPF